MKKTETLFRSGVYKLKAKTVNSKGGDPMLTHILFAILPETVILLLAFVCRTVSPLQMLPFLLLMAGLKTGYAAYHGFDHTCIGRRFLIIPAASFLLELGGLTRVYAGLTYQPSFL